MGASSGTLIGLKLDTIKQLMRIRTLQASNGRVAAAAEEELCCFGWLASVDSQSFLLSSSFSSIPKLAALNLIIDQTKAWQANLRLMRPWTLCHTSITMVLPLLLPLIPLSWRNPAYLLIHVLFLCLSLAMQQILS